MSRRLGGSNREKIQQEEDSLDRLLKDAGFYEDGMSLEDKKQLATLLRDSKDQAEKEAKQREDLKVQEEQFLASTSKPPRRSDSEEVLIGIDEENSDIEEITESQEIKNIDKDKNVLTCGSDSDSQIVKNNLSLLKTPAIPDSPRSVGSNNSFGIRSPTIFNRFKQTRPEPYGTHSPAKSSPAKSPPKTVPQIQPSSTKSDEVNIDDDIFDYKESQDADQLVDIVSSRSITPEIDQALISPKDNSQVNLPEAVDEDVYLSANSKTQDPVLDNQKPQDKPSFLKENKDIDDDPNDKSKKIENNAIENDIR